ncbi:MAG TPA: hypothetical protein VJ783_10820 [Pirellulales bacterium]|nr:hypothetical protein [Pirellulales bacterium]
MTRIVVDDTLRGLLHDFSRPLEFCDEQGHVLGRFVPENDTAVAPYEPPPLSEEEMKRREAEEPTYTTAEVLAYLESLE